MLQEVTLGPQAFAYMRSSLLEGGTLSHELLRLTLEQGEVKTCLPVGVGAADAYDFLDGWKVPTVGGGRGWVAPFVAAYLSVGDHRYAVLETLCGPSDPGLRQGRDRYFLYDTEVYYFLTRQSTNQEIDSALGWARRYPFVAALTSLEGAFARIRDRKCLSRGVLKAMADRAEYLLIGAYDDEGALLWGRTPSTSARCETTGTS